MLTLTRTLIGTMALLPIHALAIKCVTDEEASKNNRENTTDIQICVHGTCIDNECICYSGYTGESCNTLYSYFMGEKYLIYFYFNCIIWLLLSIYLFWHSFQFFKNSRQWNMKHLSLALLLVGSFLRVPSYWIAIDGNFDRNTDLQPFGSLTYYFFYPCVISSYTCEIFIWIEILIANVVYAPIQRLPRMRKLFIVVNILIFVVELLVRILSYVYRESLLPSTLFVAWAIYVGSVALLETIGSLIIGVKVLKEIKAIEIHEKSKVKKRVKNMTHFVVVNTIVLIAAIAVSGLSAMFNSATVIWYVLNWVARPLEVAGVLLISVAIKPPKNFLSSSKVSTKIECTDSSAKKVDSSLGEDAVINFI